MKMLKMLKMPSISTQVHPCSLNNIHSHPPDRLLVIRRRKLFDTFYKLFNRLRVLQIYLLVECVKQFSSSYDQQTIRRVAMNVVKRASMCRVACLRRKNFAWKMSRLENYGRSVFSGKLIRWNDIRTKKYCGKLIRRKMFTNEFQLAWTFP